MTIPTEADWGDYRKDLDQSYAHTMFAGRSIQDVLPLFRQNVLQRSEDLLFMPSIPFRYYIFAFREYVMSDAVLEDEVDASSAADSFLGLVEHRLREDPDSIAPIINTLLPAVRFVAANQDRYHATVAIYGTFSQRLERIEEGARRLTSA